MNIGILGSGKMGATLGQLFAARGHNVTIGSRMPEKTGVKFSDIDRLTVEKQQVAINNSDLIIIATPWAVTKQVLETLDISSEKIILDITNPLSPDVSHLVVGGTTSAAEEIAHYLNSNLVVKAFNGINAANLEAPDFSGNKAQILYCGDNIKAKGAVKSLIEELGFFALDCGDLKNAVYLEAMAMLWIQLAFVEGHGLDCAFTFSCV